MGPLTYWDRKRKKLKKVKTKLDRSRNQIDTIFLLYSYVLTCRSPATNYSLFLLERYLLLKVKAIKDGKPIELKATEDFISCCKEHGEKFQRFFVNFICIISYQKENLIRTLSILLEIFNSSLLYLLQLINLSGLRHIIHSKDKNTGWISG